MSTCKECIHYDICINRIRYHADENEFTGKELTDMDKACKRFKDKSKFIELPCKVGDKVYQIVYCYDRKTYPATKYPDHYVEKEVVGIHICDSRLRVNALSNKKYRDYLIVGRCNALEHIPFAKIGKSVFLTKEEAEQALAERGVDNG